MFGTTYGFHLSRRRVSGATGGGGGTGEQVRFAKDQFTQSVAWTSGALTLALSQTPMDNDGLTVWSQGQELHPDDYTILSGPNRVVINFPVDPATDTDTGTWSFVILYPYLL